MKYTKINKDLFCNLSRLPVNYKYNPLVLTAKSIIKKNDIKFEETELFNHFLKMKMTNKPIYGIYKSKCNSFRKIPKYSPFLPWLHNSFKFTFDDIAFIGNNRSFYLNSFIKLKNLIFSIKRNGYRLDTKNFNRSSAINGFYIQYKNKKKFYVTRGNHRLAAHISLFPSKKIPIIFDNCFFFKKKEKENNEVFRQSCVKYFGMFSKYPIIFKSSDAKNWPSVKNNLINIKLAIAILKEYFD